jgi:protein gp37
MGDKSSIEWTSTHNSDGSVTAGATWNPTVGCMKVSAGCEHCYAINTAYRLDRGFSQPAYAGLTRKLPDGSVNWTGKVRTLPERLALPLRWHKPRRIFVDSMSDLFHDDVPDEFITEVFASMNSARRHTFQVLTKRPERMLAFIRGAGARHELQTHPLPNVWLGVSVEDQRAADERIPLLLQTPAAVRWLSCEPLIGPVDLSQWLDNISDLPPLFGTEWLQPPTTPTGWYQINEFEQPLQWVVAGGESGQNYRPLDLDWARSLRDQCQAAGVAYHFKQVGGRTHGAGGRLLDGRTWDEYPQPARALTHA